jgi:DNA-directed RNA polymerase subunit RPC12/RpoP
MTDTTIYECVTCASSRVFEHVLNLDEHRSDTDEWACTICGSALFVDPTLDLEGAVPAQRSSSSRVS